MYWLKLAQFWVHLYREIVRITLYAKFQLYKEVQ